LEYLSLGKIREKITSADFVNLSVKEAEALLKQARAFITESKKPPDRPVFEYIEKSINEHIQTKKNLLITWLGLVIAGISFLVSVASLLVAMN
jgi:hypothetical protein